MIREDWIGGLPSDWTITRLGALGSLGKGSGGSKEDNRDSGVPVVRYGELYTKFDRVIRNAQSFISPEDTHRYTPLPTGSLVFAASGEDPEEIGKVALSLLSSPAFVGGDSVVFTPRTSAVDPVYLTYVLDSKPLRAQKAIRSTGFTVVHISAGKLKTLPIPLPHLDAQRAIADYLDQETAQIDALVAKQEEFVGLLRERRDVAWASGLERAIEERPPIPLRRAITSIVDGPFGSSLTSAHYADSGTRVIRLGNIGTNSFRVEDEAYIPDSYADQLAGHNVRPGDVVIAGLGDETWPLGRAAVVPDIGPAIVKADCFRARPAAGVSGSYLAWALSAPQTRSQVALLARGSTRKRINTSIARTIEIPVPSPERQESILGDSEDELARIDALIAKAGEHIALAKERRAALITAAVTGQIDIRAVWKAS